MFRLGKVLHVSSNNNIILRTKILPILRTPALDDQLKQVGIVSDLFGPADHPYVSVRPSLEGFERYVGKTLYVMKAERGGEKQK